VTGQTFASVVENRLSPERFAPYLAACGNRRKDAIKLYHWNIRISGALYEAMHVLEVVLRNALHTELQELHVASGNGGSWLDHPATYFTDEAKGAIGDAKARVKEDLSRKNGSAPTILPANKIVAELSLGFWRFLLTSHYTHTLWTPGLRKAFPNLQSGNLADVEHPTKRVHELRNRIAHLEPIHAEDLAARYRDMRDVVGYVCEPTREWMHSSSRVKPLLDERNAELY
jgi:hypothetical protein